MSDSGALSPVLRRRVHGRGYRLGGELVDGFGDRPDLPLQDRLKIARWAKVAGVALSEEQRRILLESDTPEPSEIQKGWAQDRARADRLADAGLFAELTHEQTRLIRKPSLDRRLSGAEYPLSDEQLATLTGADESDIRHWSAQGRLTKDLDTGPSFWPSDVAVAFALLDARRCGR